METGELDKKEPWIDIVKWTACMLVLLGHFFQSMIKSGILRETALDIWFQQTIYLFHVPLFFICSGYLYQRNRKVTTFHEWKNNVLTKAVNLGVPYFTFSSVTYLMKAVFSGSVNTENEKGLLYTLFIDPISPYWYLYFLFFIFLLTPTLKSRKQGWIALVISLLVFPFQDSGWMYHLQVIASREIWFVTGMMLCLYRDRVKFNSKCFFLCFLLFPISILVYDHELSRNILLVYKLVIGLLGCFLVLESAFFLNNKVPDKMIQFSRRNTMPIFLMHTIFAAGVRSVLLKIGITNAGIHIVLGIGSSIILPVIAAEIMRKSKWLSIFIQPGYLCKGETKGSFL